MKKLVLGIMLGFQCLFVFAQTVGVVVKADGDCRAGHDRMIFQTRSGYVLAEHYRGRFVEGRSVYGNLHSYGFKDIKVDDNDGRIYIEDYMASKDTAANWCFGKNE